MQLVRRNDRRGLAARTLPLLALAALLQGCGGGGGGTSSVVAPPPVTQPAALSDSAALGAQMFVDASLSASGKLSCASCHVPGRAHAPADGLAVQLGGPTGSTPGQRATPSLRYQSFTPQFSFGKDGLPVGGYDADGRVSTLAEQAANPLLAAHEMANVTKAALVDRLRHAAYAERFRSVFGTAIFDDPEQAFERATFALQQYQRQDAVLFRFDAKFDKVQQGQAAFSAAEQRGLALFKDPAKGNCVACHSATPLLDGTPALFTSFGFYALGVPRNAALAAPGTFDLGLCGPDRTDLAARADLCGAFKVPSLRNVATRAVFFHNGVLTSLRDAVRFHVQRDTDPALWYPAGADGRPRAYNDLPAQYHANVVRTAPFDRAPGAAPALTAAEIDDIVQFLHTLNDADQPQPQ